MFDQFITWEMLKTFGTLVMITYMVVEFTKEIPYIKLIPTKYYAGVIALILIILTQIQSNTLVYMDIPLYILSAIAITFSSTGVSDFNGKK